MDKLLQSLQAEILTVQPHHANLVVNSYFDGSPPFKQIKNREDFPDAFIFESVKDLKAQLGETVLHFVVADNVLREALSQINGVVMHKDLNEFVQCQEVEILARQSDVEKLWNEVYKTILPNLPSLEEIFRDSIRAMSVELTYKQVTHQNIPEDNQEAVISAIYEPEKVSFDWENTKNYGAGLITIPFEFETISEIEFNIYRADAFTINARIWIEYKDIETNHYFDAGGEVKVAVRGTTSVQFENKKFELDKLEESLIEIQFSEIKEIEILEDEEGNIFIEG
jgi:hypothetical protein